MTPSSRAVWRLATSTDTPTLVSGATDEWGQLLFSDDNSPCVLPDSRRREMVD